MNESTFKLTDDHKGLILEYRGKEIRISKKII